MIIPSDTSNKNSKKDNNNNHSSNTNSNKSDSDVNLTHNEAKEYSIANSNDNYIAIANANAKAHINAIPIKEESNVNATEVNATEPNANNKANDSICSISFSISNSKDIDDLYDKLSSGYSSTVECEFQNENVIHSLSGANDYYHFANMKREIIPEEVKEASYNFLNEIMGQYNEKNKMIGNKEISVSTKIKTGYNTFPKTPTLSTENEIQNANRLIRELQAKKEEEGEDGFVGRSGIKKVSNYKKTFKEPDFNHLNPNASNNNQYSDEVDSDKNKNKNQNKDSRNHVNRGITLISSEGYVQTLPNNEEEISKKTKNS